LLRRKDKALAFLFPALELADLALRICEAVFEFLNLAAITGFGVGLHFFNDREGAFPRSPAAHRDQVAIAGQLVDHVLGKSEVAVRRHDDALA